MERVIRTITQAFSHELGASLESIYLFGSVAERTYNARYSDVNLLLVVSEGTSIHKLRTVFLPIWKEHRRLLRRAPWVTTRQDLANYMVLRPVFAHHLASTGRALVGGHGLLGQLPALPSLTPGETLAYRAEEAMLASAALAPDMGTDDQADRNHQRMHRLARQVLDDWVADDETAVDLFARIQDKLEPKIAALPVDQPWSSMRTATSPLLPGLQATYTKDLEKIILVFNQLSPQQVRSIDWDKLGQRLAKDYKGIFVTSSNQLRLIHVRNTPLDMDLRRNKRTWGMDPLGGLKLKHYYRFRQAARMPADILLNAMPNAYLTAPDDELYTLIHDFQNTLLNIQLENELLTRLQIIARSKTPGPLPGREAPNKTRIDAILKQLRWWAEHYLTLMQQADI